MLDFHALVDAQGRGQYVCTVLGRENTTLMWNELRWLYKYLTMTMIILWPDTVNSVGSSSSALYEHRSCNIESKSIEAEVDLLQHIDEADNKLIF